MFGVLLTPSLSYMNISPLRYFTILWIEVEKLESTTDPARQRFVSSEIAQCVPGIDLWLRKLSARELFPYIWCYHHQPRVRVAQMRYELVTVGSSFRGLFVHDPLMNVVLAC